MSELKPYIGPHPTDTTLTEYYLKSEADKVIEELKSDYKEACDRLQTANLINDEQLAATRHQKYSRCLAMAEWCLAVKELNRYGDQDYMDFAEKWHERWLKLAEKFKPNKETK